VAATPDPAAWKPVASSNVRAIQYDRTFRRLFISFLNGSVYRYEDVPESVWYGLITAASVGKYVHRVIRANGTDSAFAYAKLR